MVGTFGVYFGAEWLVKGSSNLAREFGISPLIVGLTVVAFGTSSPELAVSLTAAINEYEDIAVGNIIGSNIANIGLVLGITAVVFPLKVEKLVMKRELPLMIGISVAFYFMAMDESIGFIDGLILFTGIILFTGYQVYRVISTRGKARNVIQNTNTDKSDTSEGMTGEVLTKTTPTASKSLFNNMFSIIVGLAGLLIGARLLVQSAIFIADKLGVSEMVIGLTVVAIGTSVPEMATSVVSALRKEADICVGNIIGSNIFNILMVIGSVALIRPLNVSHDIMVFELPVMVLFSMSLIFIVRGSLNINRIEGSILALGYFIFIFFLFI